MGDLLEERREQLTHPRPRQAAEEAFPRVLGAVRDDLLFGEGGVRRDERALILSLAQMFTALLGTDPVPGDYSELLARYAAAGQISPAPPDGSPAGAVR